MNIPICCVAYNRVNSLRRLLYSLKAADFDGPVTLIISIDKSDSTDVEEFADSYQWIHGEKRVIKQSENLGLRRHVLTCGDLLKDYDALVVLEDDITVAQSFYTYAKQCVEKYKDCMDCAGISLYNFPLNYHNGLPFTPIHSDSDVYMMKCAQSWGQVWMKRQWFEFEKWYENHNEEFGDLPHLPHSICSWPKSSWLKYHTRYCIEDNKFFIYPYISLSTNNGDAGAHVSRRSSAFQSSMLNGYKSNFNLNPTVQYDGFFENEAIYSFLGIHKNELCVDLYGEKKNRERKRYWLTLHKMKQYRIVKSYGLDFKPIDANILFENPGYQIFLYDTSQVAQNSFNGTNELIDYYFSVNANYLYEQIRNVSIKKIRQFADLIFQKK